ncbi:MAG: NUDIX domain-containing protein [Nanoarchaeota archaeon]|nr:NUDIX domain-containing protein [Nanoarchaeota archaeon]
MDKNKAHYVAATAIIIKDGKYLITRRSDKETMMPGLWTVPGGKLEMTDYTARKKDAGELWYNVIEGLLKREVKEETGLDIHNISYLTSMAFIRPDGTPTVVISLFADHGGGSVKLSSELTDHAWVTLEEAENYPLIEGIYEELEMLDNLLKGKELVHWRKR